MRKPILYKDQKNMLRRMLPFALLMFVYYMGDKFFAYMTLFQQLHGFSTQTIGKVVGISCIMVIFGEMILSRISDAVRSVKLAAIGGMTLTGVCSILIPVSSKWYVGTFAMVLVLIVARETVVTPACTMMENWVLRSSYQERFDYGLTKATGTAGGLAGSVIASAVMTFLCSRMEQVRAIDSMLTAGACITLAAAFLMIFLKDAPAAPKENGEKRSLNPMRMMRNFDYLALVIMYCFYCLTMNPTGSFLSVLMTENQLDVTKLSLILGLEAIFQFPMLFLFTGLNNRFSPRPLIVAGLLLNAVATVLRAYATGMWVLVLAAAFSGMGGSLMFSAAYNYIFQLVPAELRASGHAYFICFGSFGAAFGATAGGYAIAAWGVQRFYLTFGLAAAAVGITYFAVTQIHRNVVKQCGSLKTDQPK